MKRVYLFRGQHPMYETMVNAPPEGVEYLPLMEGKGVEEYTLYNPGKSVIRRGIDDAYGLLRIPRFYPIFRKYDLVHSARGFIILGPNKYVVDFEHASSFGGMRHRRTESSTYKTVLEKSFLSDKCGALLPHCQAALKTLSLVTSDRRIDEKTTVIYPSVVLPDRVKTKKEDSKPTLLFIGEYYWKGGREVLGACRGLSSKLDFRLIFISNWIHPPQETVDESKKAFEMEYIQGPVPRKQLLERIYPMTDIFVMPTYLDTFGYVFLEAMSHRIPCVGTNHFAVPEIIDDGETGLLVDPAISFFDSRGVGHPEIRIDEIDFSSTETSLRAALESLISSRSLRDRMGSAGYREVESGKFSITRRNSLLKSVYGKVCG